jgi:hypothetical protein
MVDGERLVVTIEKLLASTTEKILTCPNPTKLTKEDKSKSILLLINVLLKTPQKSINTQVKCVLSYYILTKAYEFFC